MDEIDKKVKVFASVYIEALDIASAIHSKLQSRIDVSKKDKKLAIYYLQGGCITHAYLAIKEWEIGDLNAPFVHKRIIQESNALALFFSSLPEGHRYIKAFFKGQIVTMPKDILSNTRWKAQKEYILKKMHWDEKIFKEFQEKGKELADEFSKSVHPQIEVVAFNSDRKTGEYDYQLSDEGFKGGFIRNFDFGHYIIIPAIDPLQMNSEILSIEDEDMKKFQNIREQVFNTGKEIFNNLRDSVLDKYRTD